MLGMGIGVGNASTRCKRVGGFGSALLKCELAWDWQEVLRGGSDDSGMV